MARQNRATGGRPVAGSDRATSRGSRPGFGGGREDLAEHRARLHGVIAPVVESAGYDLEELVLSRAGRRHLVRVLVDGEGGINLDEVAEISREIAAALDEAEDAGGAFTATEYVLEVGSPGVDRPLTLPRHWRRNAGRLVSVTAGAHRITGRVLEAGEDGVTLDIEGRRQEYRYADLGPGRVQVEFNRANEIADEELDELDQGGPDASTGAASAHDDEFDDEQEEDEP